MKTIMKRTISAMVGKGSVNHNSRKFNAKNTDPERSRLNVSFCNENIKTVYHELFDEAQKRFNERQTRSDRCIENYYEKIRSGKQEKPFHELILQIGNCDDTAVGTEAAEITTEILKEYFADFQKRNPHLRVFSAHIHLDEHTPHIHIDFVPFTTGSKRGLDTRVSLKQALLQQGFKGDGKHDNEWNRWVQSEKEELAIVMERHGIEWEQKGTHEKHLSDYDYKKKMRAAEVEELSEKVVKLREKITNGEDEYREMSHRIENYEKGNDSLEKLEKELDTSPDYALPEPQGLMTAKNYKTRFVDPLIKKLKQLAVSILARYFKVVDDYHHLLTVNNRCYRANERLEQDNEYLTANNAELRKENTRLRSENKDFALLRKVFGKDRIDALVTEAHELQKNKRNRFNERG